MIKAVVFDMDGLMIDTEPIYRQSWKEAAGILGYTLTDAQHDRFLGVGPADCYPMMIEMFGVQFPINQFDELWRKRFESISALSGITPKKGLFALLEKIEELSLKKGLVTSSSREMLKFSLNGLGLEDRFDLIVTSDDVSKCKPDPELYAFAAKKLKCKPEEALALEDSNNGIRSATAAGLLSIMVPDTAKPDPDVEAAALAVVDSLLDAIKIVEKLAIS
jgi:HAD superfamily hydrolase (TIGR01509 family)